MALLAVGFGHGECGAGSRVIGVDAGFVLEGSDAIEAADGIGDSLDPLLMGVQVAG